MRSPDAKLQHDWLALRFALTEMRGACVLRTIFDSLSTMLSSRRAIRSHISDSACARCSTNVRDFYKFGRLLNRGLSAEVYEGVSINSGVKVAIKVYFEADRHAVHETITEHVCMSRVKCEHVLQCHGVMFDGKRPCLVLQLAQQSLRDFLQVRPRPPRAHRAPRIAHHVARVARTITRWPAHPNAPRGHRCAVPAQQLP